MPCEGSRAINDTIKIQKNNNVKFPSWKKVYNHSYMKNNINFSMVKPIEELRFFMFFLKIDFRAKMQGINFNTKTSVFQ